MNSDTEEGVNEEDKEEEEEVITNGVAATTEKISIVLDLHEDKRELICDFNAYTINNTIHYGFLTNELKKY